MSAAPAMPSRPGDGPSAAPVDSDTEREQMISALERLRSQITATRDELDAQIARRRPSATR
ncbi:hypothetical protein [Patulibacter minatonensis]|uniref:hypothetical protein n=1 Tax=Patulibacter minatonensis TaxID=298163 RepID=UPI0012F9B9C6|nr:hypothetical protein [Patulibacter minatonensis]